MEISLNNFSYFFSATGNSGGLSSIDFQFKPHLIKGQEMDNIKTAARECISKYTQVLDPLYSDLIDGKKEPQLTDSPHSVSTGYQYQGRLTKKSLRVLEKRLREAFGEEVIEPDYDISIYDSQRASLMCSFIKNDTGGFIDCSVDVKFSMSHKLNVCFFRFTKKLAGIRIESAARVRMEQLEDTLKATSEQREVDYYDMLMRQLGKGASA